MNSKIKALFAVAIMVAAAVMIIIPTTDNNADANPSFDGTDTITFGGSSYNFSYPVVLSMSTYKFTVASTSSVSCAIDGNPVVATTEYDSGKVINVTATDTGTLTITIKDGGVTASTKILNINKSEVTADTYIDAADIDAVANTKIEHSVSAVGVSATTTYSALGLPVGLTMEKNGIIYGAVTTPTTDDGIDFTIYAYDTATRVYVSETCNVKISPAQVAPEFNSKYVTATYSSEKANVDGGSIVDENGMTVNSFYSDATINVAFKPLGGKTVAGVSVAGVSNATAVVNEDKQVTLDFDDGTTGEKLRGNVAIKFTVTYSDGSVYNIDQTFYVVPIGDVVTIPVADANVSYI